MSRRRMRPESARKSVRFRSLSKSPKLESTAGEEPRMFKPVLESHMDLLSDGRFSDVTFIVGEAKERIPCHQLFLKARSPVFEVMFSERWSQATPKEIPLEDVDPDYFKKFLQFIYTDTLDADVPLTLGLLELAHKYDVQSLDLKCEEQLRHEVTTVDAIAVFQAARKYQKKDLMNMIGEMMITVRAARSSIFQATGQGILELRARGRGANWGKHLGLALSSGKRMIGNRQIHRCRIQAPPENDSGVVEDLLQMLRQTINDKSLTNFSFRSN